MYKREKMTVFYQKSTGNIKCVTDWETCIDDYFVDEADKQDYGLIWDCIVMDYNDSIFNNYSLFKIDVDMKKIVLKESMLNFSL